ncbi:copper amine oxidase N-terminal domain-containing protein [Ructibacterium gallinarum]|uniref:Copper amine oxidase N-terminal domain-containing protein n=1 Tax=Ructibacterium gallinarum TaxID=2779355 RepID=A0A9D5LX42_9FIRM|nr:copper amine oxidase N-terminal domain-containing protein [Ructibacterium gallinarum]MBE5039423.1 copper amine oxidase N-terminal domain-containing protein [Ructibacterium gallinarum]
MKLKYLISVLAAGSLLLSGTSAFAAAENIIINGQTAQIPADMGSIKELDDRTFVPIRFIMENLGCQVDFIDDTKMAVISSISCTYLIQEGNQTLFVLPDQYEKTENIPMDTAAFIEEVELDGQTYGRMYVPIRFLAQAIGYEVGWDEATQTVTLTMAK